jgi:hypothetical protein
MKKSYHIPIIRTLTLRLPALFLFFFLFSCQHQNNTTTLYSDTLVFRDEPANDSLSAVQDNTTPSDNHTIYYGIYSPAEVSGIFGRKNISYNPDILSPTENINIFTTKTQVALNLGIYGADLSYIQMFGSGDAAKYLDVILNLAGQLGIPGDYISGLVQRMDKNISSSDSLVQISIDAFNHVNRFLIRENQEDLAYLILAGAWIEAMYIAAHDLLRDHDPDIIKKIVEQKYSLNYLLSSMKNYYNDTSVAYVYRRLFVLKRYLDDTEIEFKGKDVDIDKKQKQIKAAEESIRFAPETMEKIREIIFELRKQIINK